jgi:hypothetical protein
VVLYRDTNPRFAKAITRNSAAGTGEPLWLLIAPSESGKLLAKPGDVPQALGMHRFMLRRTP